MIVTSYFGSYCKKSEKVCERSGWELQCLINKVVPIISENEIIDHIILSQLSNAIMEKVAYSAKEDATFWKKN